MLVSMIRQLFRADFSPQFFEDEAIAELGHSCINAVSVKFIYCQRIRDSYGQIFGGVPQPTHSLPPNPAIIICLSNWPSFEYFRDGLKRTGSNIRYRFHDKFDITKKPMSYYWPVQIKWFEAIQGEEYWTAQVRPKQSLRPEQIIGRGFIKSDAPVERSFCPDNLIAGAGYDNWLKDPDCPSIPPILNYTRDPNTHGSRQSAISNALRFIPSGVQPANNPARPASGR